ncbi:MAG: hypothetical protein ACRD5G_11635 [Candidatus Acidiferrales bacterium]
MHTAAATASAKPENDLDLKNDLDMDRDMKLPPPFRCHTIVLAARFTVKQ